MAFLTSTDFSGLFNQRFLNNFFPIPATSLVKVGDRAPNFELPAVQSGTMFSLQTYLEQQQESDRQLLLAFTRIFTENQYCPLCFPHIQALNQASTLFDEQGIDMVMITSTDEDQSQIVAKDLMLNIPLLSDPLCRVFRLYRLGQALGAPLPAQFLIDATGHIQYRHLFSFIQPNAEVEHLLNL